MLKRILLSLSLCLSTLFFITSFGEEQKMPATDKVKAATESNEQVYNNDKTNIIVTPHQTEFTIKLKSNPSTGFSWFLREYNANLITPMKHRYQAGESNLIGASGYELYTFRVKGSAFTVPQASAIRFAYMRPSQGLENSTQTAFLVVVMSN